MFGLILSLVFVGLEMRQSQEIALSATYQARAQIAAEINLVSSSTPEFTSATAKLYAGEASKITPQEMVALEFNFGANMALIENLHFQHESGFLPEEHWDRSMEDLRCFFSSEVYRNLLQGWEYRASFQLVIDERIESATKNPSCSWNASDTPVD